MKVVNSTFGLVGFILWIAGIVFAKGFWSTLFAVVIPLWAWYLSMYHILQHIGWIT